MRPSIIVGDRHSGWTASFNVLYWPLRALAKGSYPVLPARRRAPVDVVSVDYVADAIVALASAPDAEGQTFHLTASDDASSIGELLALAVGRLGCKRPPLISPRLYRHVVHPLLCRAAAAPPALPARDRDLPAVLRDRRDVRQHPRARRARTGDRAGAARARTSTRSSTTR